MNLELIKRVIDGSDESAVDELWEDYDTMFWIDWRAEDDTIARDCEGIISTGCLRSDYFDKGEPPGFGLCIEYKGKKTTVPIIEGAEDRHITIYTLNQVLYPDYELRRLIATFGTDSAGMVVLPCETWKALEAQYGGKVTRTFYRIRERPNIFTELVQLDDAGLPVTSEPSPVAAAPADLHAQDVASKSGPIGWFARLFGGGDRK